MRAYTVPWVVPFYGTEELARRPGLSSDNLYEYRTQYV
eukprot:SAG11_NODE_32956_length_279_cov_19.705556_2_plen_37_part_01